MASKRPPTLLRANVISGRDNLPLPGDAIQEEVGGSTMNVTLGLDEKQMRDLAWVTGNNYLHMKDSELTTAMVLLDYLTSYLGASAGYVQDRTLRFLPYRTMTQREAKEHGRA